MTFIPKKVENAKAIKAASNNVANLAVPANTMLQEFKKIFSYFEIKDLKDLMASTNQVVWIGARYVDLNGFDTGKFSIEKLISLGLVQIPDYNDLLKSIERFNSLWHSNESDVFVKDISELYSIEENQFVNPLVRLDDSPVAERIYNFYSSQTINEIENKYLETLQLLGNLYTSLVNDWKVIKRPAIPIDLLSVTTMENGFIIVEPHHNTLKDFRKRNADVEIQIMEPETN